MSPVLVMIGGGGGLAGLLAPRFRDSGWEVAGVGSAPWTGGGDCLSLDWDSGGAWALALEGAGAVLQFPGAGEGETRRIAEAIRECRIPPRVWVHVSSTDWYASGIRGADEWRGERGEDGRSGSVCREEEGFFGEPLPAETRKLVMRAGLVVGPPGVGIAQGMTGRLAVPDSGLVSWIHADDLAAAVEWAVADPFVSGVINAIAPGEAAWSLCHHACLEGLLSVVVPGGSPGFPSEARAAVPFRLRSGGFRWRYPCFGDLGSRGEREKEKPLESVPEAPSRARQLAAVGSG